MLTALDRWSRTVHLCYVALLLLPGLGSLGRSSVMASRAARFCVRSRCGLVLLDRSRSYVTSAEVAAPSLREASAYLMQDEHQYSAHNYHPLPVVFARAKDATVWDPEGREYIDFLSAYSAVNQGHCHPKIVEALTNQANRLTLSSRAFFNDKFPVFAKTITRMFGYEMVLPMNTGAEGVETAIKLARKWGYEKKGIPKDEAVVISCCGCFHGRTIGVISMSCDNDATRGFWPLLPGQVKVDYGDASALASALEAHRGKVAAFLFEPIQGEAGVVVPPEGYLKEVRKLCSKYNVLMIADEIQTGIGRTGKLLACDWENIRPDVVILGKALGGGVLPVSAVLADKEIMLCIKPGEHGSTFGGNPLASAVAMASLQVIQDENLVQRAAELGEEFRGFLRSSQKCHPGIVKDVRGRGLLNAVELSQQGLGKATAYDICVALKERGILAKPTHSRIIRFSPPLTIKPQQLEKAASALREVLDWDLEKLASKSHSKQEMPPEPCDRCGRQKYT